jgi:hypothetical protein
MAKEDAAETAKEVLRQIIKHRFWISIAFAALFAVIAYFMGSGPVQAKAKTEIDNINKAEKDVQAYASPTKPTPLYKPIVVEKTEIATKDVNKAWKELYDRQAPFLTWPDVVQDRFRKWGRKWPEDVDPGKVQLAVVDYIEAYPSYVDMVYKIFNPFDYQTGKGIVAAPPKEALLRPAQFSIEGGKVPGLGKVWSAQERLWIQRTLLEVVAQVNKRAKDWDSALIKQIDVLEVGNPDAQDQRSLAKGDQPKKAEDILAPGQEAPAEGGDAGMGGGAGMMSGGMGGMSGGMGGRMAPMMGGGMRGGEGMGRAGGGQYDDTIYYIPQEGDRNQYKILPVSMTVLVDQEHVQDLLVALENSPMSIQVMDIDLERPSSRVTKPEKGEQPAGMGMGMMGMGGGMMRGMMGQQGYGGMAAQMQMSRGMMGQMGAQMGGMGRMGMGGMMGMGQMGGARDERKKVDVSSVNRKEEREKKAKELEEKHGPSLLDPYFNIVQVTVYGQARFYNPPPADAEVQPSPGDVAASPGAGDAGEKSPASTSPTGAAPAPAEKAATPTPAEKDAPAPGADAKSPKAQPEAGVGPAKPEAAKPADTTKPTAPAADAAKPDPKGTAAKK